MESSVPRCGDVHKSAGWRAPLFLRGWVCLLCLVGCGEIGRAPGESTRTRLGASSLGEGTANCCGDAFVYGSLTQIARIESNGETVLVAPVDRVETLRSYQAGGRQWLLAAAQDDGVVYQIDPISGASQRIFPLPPPAACASCVGGTSGVCEDANSVCYSLLPSGLCPTGTTACGGTAASEGSPTGLALQPGSGDLFSTDAFSGLVRRYPFNPQAAASGPHFLAPAVVPTLQGGVAASLVNPISITFITSSVVVTVGAGGSAGGGLLIFWTLGSDGQGGFQLSFVSSIDISSIHASDVMACGSRLFLSPNDADLIDRCELGDLTSLDATTIGLDCFVPVCGAAVGDPVVNHPRRLALGCSCDDIYATSTFSQAIVQCHVNSDGSGDYVGSFPTTSADPTGLALVTVGASVCLECNTASACNAPGACQSAEGAVCLADGQCAYPSSCQTLDACHSAGLCTGTQCGPPQLRPGFCFIDQQCVSAGTTDSTNSCLTCDPGATTTDWTALDGTACDDGNACTQGDSCQRGVCTGSPVICPGPDQCHQAGTCNGLTGLCSGGAKPDGTPCDDGNACTQGDSCQQGVCLGGQAIICTATDQCHTPGTCDPATGICTNPPKADGAACNDGDGCTVEDVCSAGACVGRPDEVTIALSNTVPRQIHSLRAVISGSANAPSAIASVTIGGTEAATISSPGGVDFAAEVDLAPGPNTFVVQATDACGSSAGQTVGIDFINHPPAWDAISPITLQEGTQLSVQVAATDPDGDVLTYVCTGRPGWLQFDPQTRAITLSPGYGSAGSYTATFTASDDIAAPVAATVSIVVSAAGSWVGGGVASCATAGNGLFALLGLLALSARRRRGPTR